MSDAELIELFGQTEEGKKIEKKNNMSKKAQSKKPNQSKPESALRKTKKPVKL